MEKFAVDLDKVLDDFEFNEEQAFHQENFKNEELPAKRYQKPHFQPINMADADFSPSVETTLPFITHNRKSSQDSTNSSIASDNNVMFNFKCTDITHPVISDLIEAPVNCQTVEDNSQKIGDSDKVNVVSSNCNSYCEENQSESFIVESENTVEDNELIEENKMKVDGNSFSVDVIPDKINENFDNKVEETQTVPDLIGNECSIEEKAKDEIPKLPDLTDVNKESFLENENSKVENFDLISNEKEVCEVVKKEKEEESVKIFTDNSEPEVKNDDDSNPQEPQIEPIQFQCEIDITDEDLHRYLEELEEEEKLAAESTESTDSKPVRPDFLNLSEKNEPERSNSHIATPLPRNLESTDELVTESIRVNVENEIRKTAVKATEPESTCSRVVETVDELEISSGETENQASMRQPTEQSLTLDERRLGKVSPFWMPDHLAANCMDCDSKFTVIKRRHHCRACGRILCSKCCGMRASLEYLQNQEQRVCTSCFHTLAKVMMYELQYEGDSDTSPSRRPNPNNPMEYCSTVPPPLQVSSSSSLSPPSVLVPVGVLKREGTAKLKENPKQVMFSDGIRPGGDLTELDNSVDQKHARRSGNSNKRGLHTAGGHLPSNRIFPPMDPTNQSFVLDKGLPPVCIVNKGETTYQENWPHPKLMERLKDPSSPPVPFAVNKHLVVNLKIVKLECCMNKMCWVFSTKGMECVGQDEILILLALKDEEDNAVPRDIFVELHEIYQEASKGNTITELGYWCVMKPGFLESQQHGGFLFIRRTFQCLNHIETPPNPFLVGILIHKSEIPWAQVFPIRLMLRLGAEFRYYPCPLVSVRFREPVYYVIGPTIIKLLADFHNLSYTLPNVRGLRIHIEAKQASILIPRNRYDQVVRALNNSNEPVLALAGNFSEEADAHLVCMQAKKDGVAYETQTIHINEKPRKVTGASFVVLNGALKTTSGLSAKSTFVEDGLLVQVPNETMTVLRNKLRNMEDWSVKCGPIDGGGPEEVVKIVWCEDDKNFNIGVKSVIDGTPLDGVPSIRTHNFADCYGSAKFIRWTQVFIIKCEDGATSVKIGEPLDVNKLSESIARATCIALKKLLDLLAVSGLLVIAVRATIDQDNVGYEAGSNGEKLPPIYMNSLDNELIPVLHKAASVNDSVAVLELVFHIMDQ